MPYVFRILIDSVSDREFKVKQYLLSLVRKHIIV